MSYLGLQQAQGQWSLRPQETELPRICLQNRMNATCARELSAIRSDPNSLRACNPLVASDRRFHPLDPRHLTGSIQFSGCETCLRPQVTKAERSEAPFC